MRTTVYCRNEDYNLCRREMHLGASVSFRSLIRTGTSLASQSRCLQKPNFLPDFAKFG